MAKYKAKSAVVVGLPLAVALVALSELGALAQPELATNEQVLVSPRPLMDVSFLLEKRYAKPVTYEDPVWSWRGDSVARGSDPDGPVGRWLWDRHFALPQVLAAGGNPALDVALLDLLVREYNKQNDGDASFGVLQSSSGLHIVPSLVRDEGGRLVAAGSPLDTPINVAGARRMPSEHFRAICDAVTRVSGTPVRFFSKWLDQLFAPNGSVPRYGTDRLATQEEKERYSFLWGATGMTAREAVTTLIESSATTLSWRLLCQPSARPQNRSCVLNVDALQIMGLNPDGKPATRPLSYDRCGKCLFLSHPPPG